MTRRLLLVLIIVVWGFTQARAQEDWPDADIEGLTTVEAMIDPIFTTCSCLVLSVGADESAWWLGMKTLWDSAWRGEFPCESISARRCRHFIPLQVDYR